METTKNPYLFQYCQKIVIFSYDFKNILLAKRKGEDDFDGTFSFIGGKMEITDKDIIEGISREKTEEIGSSCRIKLFRDFNIPLFYKKNDGHSMILPHYFSQFIDGEIILNEEYSSYLWLPIEEIESFEPKIQTIPYIIKKMLSNKDFLMRGYSEII